MTLRILPALLLGVATVTLGPVACNTAGTETAATPGNGLGIQASWMDHAVKPGDNFYSYANGVWMAKTEIPADRSNTGSHWIANEQLETNLAQLIGDLQKSEPEAGTDAARVKAYYDAFLDTATIDKLGMAP